MPDIRIIAKFCKGCGLCVPVCPKNFLSLADAINARGAHLVQVDPTGKCTGCGNCTTMCPDAAIEIEE